MTALSQLSYHSSCDAVSWARTNDIRLGRLNFLIQTCCLCLFLYYYYNKFFVNCQGVSFVLAKFFVCCGLCLWQYSVLKIYIQNIHCDFCNTNNHLCRAKSIEEAVDAFFSTSLTLNPLFRMATRSIKPLFAHLLSYRHLAD